MYYRYETQKEDGTWTGICTIFNPSQRRKLNRFIHVPKWCEKDGNADKKPLLLVMAIAIAMLISTSAFASPSISKKRMTLMPGEKVRLTLTGVKGARWKSSNKRVASVAKDGTVTAKKAGLAAITACKGRVRLTCKVSVTLAKPTSLSLNADYVKMGKGKTFRLKAFVWPDLPYLVRWASSDKSIATISANGIIRAKKKGNVLISAWCGTMTQICVVTVTKKKAGSVHRVWNRSKKTHTSNRATAPIWLCRCRDERKTT